MIKFFRAIRHKYLSEGKVGKYLQYAIGEIILVVIGILIALQINNWNEQRKKINLSDKALLELQEEAESTMKLIERKNAINLKASDIMKKYLEGGYVNPTDSIKDVVVGHSFAYNPIQLSIPVVEREISANNVIIGHDCLVGKLQKFKEVQILAIQLKFYLDNFWNVNMIPYLKDQGLMLSFVSKAGMLDEEVEGLSILYDFKAFKDLVAMEFMHVQSYANKIEELRLILEEIVAELEEIINTPGH